MKNIESGAMAHLHRGDADNVGPSVLGLRTPKPSARECRRGLGTKVIRKIKQNISNYYVDVHNNEFGGGALRGQLTRSP